jgi:hypothetical protein
MYKKIETLGTLSGIIGAFLVAGKYPDIGYPFFFMSSMLLLTSSIAQKQTNYIALQGVFLLANIYGLINYL